MFTGLEVYWIGVYGGGLFVPFRDAGNGSLSYGGGRYLLDTVKGADLGSADLGSTLSDELILDFNFAYHPSCFYDPRRVSTIRSGAARLHPHTINSVQL
ncbi:DUF1684 domain-containing protein [Deinococcus sp.]|uniref:DUF1684 domain-containing protein n=1 Tax=Deinococcus sp. TaxID=47478 RepID=UPI0025DBF109|nr:DUF1684 domain-containing protein [Deinococcus sp.]